MNIRPAIAAPRRQRRWLTMVTAVAVIALVAGGGPHPPSAAAADDPKLYQPLVTTLRATTLPMGGVGLTGLITNKIASEASSCHFEVYSPEYHAGATPKYDFPCADYNGGQPTKPETQVAHYTMTPTESDPLAQFDYRIVGWGKFPGAGGGSTPPVAGAIVRWERGENALTDVLTPRDCSTQKADPAGLNDTSSAFRTLAQMNLAVSAATYGDDVAGAIPIGSIFVVPITGAGVWAAEDAVNQQELLIASSEWCARVLQGEQLDTIKTDVSGLKTDVSGLKTDVSGLKTDVSGLKTDVSGLKTDVSALKTDLAAQKQLSLRMEIEADLANEKPPVALFTLPNSQGGYLELTRTIVGETIAKMKLTNQKVGDADKQLAAGDAAKNAGKFKEAYDKYRKAYRAAVS